MANEIQRFYWGSQASPIASGNVEAGTFTLTFDGQATSSLNFDDSAATIQAALEALSNIGAGNVSVSLTSNGFAVEFVGALADANQPLMTFWPTDLKQKADTVNVATSQNGVPNANEVQVVDLGGATTGNFDINGPNGFSTVSTLDLTGIQNAIDGAAGMGNHSTTDIGGGQFRVEFIGTHAAQNISLMTVSNNTTDGSPTVNANTDGGSGGTPQIVQLTLPDSPTEGMYSVDLGGDTGTGNYGETASVNNWQATGFQTWTRLTNAANVSVSGAEFTTPLRRSVSAEIVTTQPGSAAPPEITSIDPSTGSTAGGTAVTITGTGFSGASVTIGGSAATSVVVVSPTEITCVTPAHAAGAVDVVVTNADTQSDTLAGGFTYQASGGPSGRLAKRHQGLFLG